MTEVDNSCKKEKLENTPAGVSPGPSFHFHALFPHPCQPLISALDRIDKEINPTDRGIMAFPSFCTSSSTARDAKPNSAKMADRLTQLQEAADEVRLNLSSLTNID